MNNIRNWMTLYLKKEMSNHTTSPICSYLDGAACVSKYWNDYFWLKMSKMLVWNLKQFMVFVSIIPHLNFPALSENDVTVFPLLSYKDCLYCPLCRRQIRPEILKPSVCCCTMVSSFQTSLIIKLKNITNSFTKSVQTFIKNVEKRNISSKCNLTFINIAKLPYWLSIWFYPRKEIISGRF